MSRCLVLSGLLLLLALFSACSSLVLSSSSSSSLVGPPTISANFINKVLETYDSPAWGLGQTFYDLGVEYNIDPAFALAFFRHESHFGTRGMATVTRSIGNIRCLQNYPCYKGYALFPSWEEGLRAWYILISGPLYVEGGLKTLPEIIHRYAPAADSNDESAYVRSVQQAVTTWRQGLVS
jgi:hypothetical protein